MYLLVQSVAGVQNIPQNITEPDGTCYVVFQHNGTEKKHSWFLEYVEVTNMNTEQVWVFPCGKWLSLYIRDPALKRVLRAHTKEVEYRGGCGLVMLSQLKCSVVLLNMRASNV